VQQQHNAKGSVQSCMGQQILWNVTSITGLAVVVCHHSLLSYWLHFTIAHAQHLCLVGLGSVSQTSPA
jgi:hypothetical protein